METKQIKEILEIFEASGLSHMEIEEGNLKIKMEKPAGELVAQPIPRPVVQEEPTQEEPMMTIDSPLVGTFYRAKSLQAKPYVEIGDHVHVNDVVCMVEAMKTMNEIHSDKEGIVTQILVEDKEMVEYGQPLIVLGEKK